MNDKQVAHALYLDDVYRVERVLADGIDGKTELVSIEDTGPFVRKSIPVEIARRRVWSALADCRCPRLPHVEQTYELPDRFVVVYDFIPGDTLESYIEEADPLPQERAFSLAADICEAAQALHEQSVIHRDISPRNVIVSADGAHLIDLGIARLRVEGATRDTASLGTWGFASPEQYGFKQTDARSDVYSIGCLLGYMVTGVRPDADGYEEALGAPTITERCRDIVRKACAFEPSARYQSAAELAADLLDSRDASGGDLPNSCLSGGRAVAEGERVAAAAAVGNGEAAAALGGAEAGVFNWEKVGGEGSGKQSGHAAEHASGQGAGRQGGHFKIAFACAAVAVVCVAGAVGYSQIAGLQSGAGEDGASAEASAVSSEASGAQSAASGAVSSDASGDVADESKAPVAQTAGQSAENPLVISESGWSVTSSGYVHYAVTLKNESETETVITPTYMVVGRDESGNVVFSKKRVVSAINPGETFFDADQAGDGNVPASIDFTPVAPDDYNMSQTKTASSFSVLNLSEKKGNLGETSFVGELRTDKTGNSPSSKQVMVTVHLRDAEGKLVAGYSSFVPAPAEGETMSFSVTKIDDIQYASAEAYAEPW